MEWNRYINLTHVCYCISSLLLPSDERQKTEDREKSDRRTLSLHKSAIRFIIMPTGFHLSCAANYNRPITQACFCLGILQEQRLVGATLH